MQGQSALLLLHAPELLIDSSEDGNQNFVIEIVNCRLPCWTCHSDNTGLHRLL